MVSSTRIWHFFKEAGIWLGVFLIGFSSLYYFHDLSKGARILLEYGKDIYQTSPQKVSKAVAQKDPADEYEERIEANKFGHFYTMAEVNGEELMVLIDTGATFVSLNYEDALKIGFDPIDQDFTILMQTANGIKKSAPVMLDRVEIGNIEVRNVQAIISPPGTSSSNLLGMSFINQLERFELNGDELIMAQ